MEAGKHFLFLAICWPLLSWTAAGQVGGAASRGLTHPEMGLPLVSVHYAPQEYEQQPTNWGVVQDSRGLIYAANNDGILQYDGSTWRLIPTVTNTVVRSLAVSPDDTVYAGTQGDFGYLKPDSSGSLRYVSLVGKVPSEEDRNFGHVWGTHATSEGVYFQTRERIFFWNGEDMQVWKADNAFHTSFSVRDQFYVRAHEKGLMRHTGTSLQLVPGGERFDQTLVFVMAPYPGERILVGTRREGFFLYDGESFTPFPTAAEDFLGEHPLYDGCALPGGLFALATKGGGVAVINQAGELVQVLDKSTGLPDGVVNAVYADAQGGLWMALHNSGLVRTDVRASLTVYDERLGLDGILIDMQRHQGKLYAATGSGLYVLDQHTLSAQQRSSFKKIPEVPLPHALASTEYGLLAATERGVYLVKGSSAEQLTESASLTLRESEFFGDRIYIGENDGISMLQRRAGGWDIHQVENVSKEIRSLTEDRERNLWASTSSGNVLRIQNPGTARASVTSFGPGEGAPAGYTQVTSIDRNVFAISKKGIYRFQGAPAGGEPQEAFYPDTTLMPAGVSLDSLQAFSADPRGEGNMWMVYPDRILVAVQQEDGSYTHQRPAALRFSRSEQQQRIYVEEGSVLWIGDRNRLIRYDPRLDEAFVPRFPPLVRRISTLEGNRIVFGGAASEGDKHIPALEYASNDLLAEYARPEYNPILETQYQYLMEESGEGWSVWTPETRQTFTNLGEGLYHFRVRARTGAAAISREAVFSFRILPPWYRTWEAYGAYFILLVFAGLGYRHYRRVIAENRAARKQMKELKRERQARLRLKEANKTLRQANEFKEELLATTSHELRTPVTAILGFTSILQDEVPDHCKEFLGYIELNGHRLQERVDSLLDLAKLRAGMMRVHRERFELAIETEGAIQMYEPLAKKKGLKLEMEQPARPVYVELDRSHLERILNNLLDNAIKFTEEGSVTVAISREEGQARLEVRDTGVGIDEAFVPHLFEEFKQESTGLTRSYEGSGLGLTITFHLVNLMGGRIIVDSVKGQGTAFIVTFPLAKVPSSMPVLV